MSLVHATSASGRPLHLPGPAPCELLRPWIGQAILLPCGDPALERLERDEHTYLRSAAEAWQDHPEWMDFLDQTSPAWDIKRAARDLYLDLLEPHLGRARTALDFGCGIGRMATGLLDRGFTVHGVDGDLQSLQRFAWHAAGRPGSVDLYWTTDAHLPDVQVDLLLAVEVLCYFAAPELALARLVDRLRPGGIALISMEARYGWSTAPDAPLGGLDAALDSASLLHLDDDRYVQLYDEARMRSLLATAGLEPIELVPTHYVIDGPFEGLLPETASRESIRVIERRMREHPVYGPLNRIWTAIARRATRA